MRACTFFVIWCTVYWYGRVLSSEGMKLQIVLFLRLLCMVTAVMLLFGTGLRFYLNRRGLEIENAFCSLHGRLSLFGMHANTIGAICSICILFGIFLLGNCPKRKRILHVCEIAVFTVCLLMTDSRTCEISLAACLGLLLAWAVFLRRGGGVRRVLVSLAVLIACTSAAYGAMYVSAKGVSAAYQWAITWNPRAVRRTTNKS